MAEDLRASALEYHRTPVPGKLAIVATKPLANQRDLALAYSPGVAFACEAIVADPAEAARVTGRANLVAVVTNGTAVLGLGAIGPLAAKPVMEGKAVLFKTFAGIDVFDLEIDERDPDKLVDIIASLEPSFGAINLEDIKAPECFEVERKLRQRMKIPVFHDDQHGTAIIVAAAITNALKIVGKKIEEVKLVTSGAGAAALTCLGLLVRLGLKMENITVTDIAGVVYRGRKEEMDPLKERYAKDTNARKLPEVIKDADIFLGLSAPRVMKPEWVATMAAKPIVLALANPTPEILPEEVRAVREDAVIATGRSDYPNQVNNVLCFPFIFRGALDVGATTINEEMEIACVNAIADLAQAEITDEVTRAYGGEVPSFGPDYLIPRPFDRRLLVAIAPAVAKAAMESGVATRPIADLAAYRDRLSQYVFRSGLLMKPMFDRARQDRKRVCYAEGEEEKVLQAAQTVVDEGLAQPILIGRRAVVASRIKRLGLRIVPGKDFELVDPEEDHRFREYWTLYHSLTERKGVTQSSAQTVVRTRNTVIGALMVRRGEADALICGTVGKYIRHLGHLIEVIGLAPGVSHAYALTALILPTGTFFLGDTHVTPEPTAEQIAEFALLAAAAVPKFGIMPKAALLSHSNFGTRDTPTAKLMRAALELIRERAPELEVEGEMHGDNAISEQIRLRLFPNSRLKGQANLLVMPTLDAANISFNLLKTLGNGLSVGPMLMGVAMPVHVVVPSITVRGIVNMTAVAAVDAQVAAVQGAEGRPSVSSEAPQPDLERRPDGEAFKSDEVKLSETEALYGVSPEAVARARRAVGEGDLAQIEKLVDDLHPADFADLLQALTPDERRFVIKVCRHILEPETLNYLDEVVREEVIGLMSPGEVAQAVSELETDDAVDILEDLDEAEKQRVLRAIPAADRAVIEQGLTYPEDSAGRLMQRDLVAVPQHWTVGEAIDYLRANQDLPDDFYDLFVVDPMHKPIGAVPLSRAMRNKRIVKLEDLMHTEFRVVPATMDQESVAYLFRQYGLMSAPVVDDAGRLLGVITVDDVVHVIEEEAEEDLLGIVGVSETDFHAPALETAWRRVRWLVVTLCNSAIASTVISQFEATIEQIVALAILMPIVAAMGGNAGVQVITVMVRALATRDLQPRGSNVWRVVGKEIAVAAINAAVFALIMGTVTSFFFGLPIGLVLGAAMVFNMIWAGIAGTLIPLTLARFGIDPAIGAGPFLTTTTDVFGFFSFLGLATLFLL